MEAGHSSLWRNAIDNPQPWVSGFCAVVFAILIGVEIWSTATALRLSPSTVKVSNVNSPERDQQLVTRITEAELFGHAPNQDINLPETGLQVSLRAVFAAADPKQASAVIETADGHSEIVKVGGSIGGSATLNEVLDNRVVLARNGVLETLYFPPPQESAEFNVAQVERPATTGEPTNAPVVPADASPDEIKRAAILQRLEELRARSSWRE